MTINCSAVVDTLFESELFGHVRGAFTGAVESKAGVFETAQGGTLFLDEIGELPLSVQAKLLRALENGEVQRVGSLQLKRVDVTVIAATNRDLRAEVAAGRFRGDLFYRLNVVEVMLPPLRDRREDIPYLTAAFMRESAQRIRKPLNGITPQAERLLLQAVWEGNVRELKNVIERACMLADGNMLSERELAGAFGPETVAPARSRPADVDRAARRIGAARRDRARAHRRRAAPGQRQPHGGGEGAGHQPPRAVSPARSPPHWRRRSASRETENSEVRTRSKRLSLSPTATPFPGPHSRRSIAAQRTVESRAATPAARSKSPTKTRLIPGVAGMARSSLQILAEI